MTIIQNAGTGEVSTGFYNNVVTQSLRFEDGDAAYLSKTYGSAGNRKTWTLSFWIKFSTIQAQTLFATRTDTNPFGEIRFESDGGFFFYGYTGSAYQYRFDSTALFRDTSAWYNFVFLMDTTDGTEGNRTKIYVNGSQLTAFDNSTYPTQNLDTNVNNAVEHDFGYDVNATTQAFDGYLAEVNFIDGTALTPASFGETIEGIWIPKDTSGLTFGTNGFRLQFEQTGTGTASTSTIGADTSGQTNHFTSTNLAATDSNMPDCPENNFNTANPLHKRLDGTVVISEGNLKISAGSDYGGDNRFAGTIAVSSGKWYFEMLRTDATGLGNQTATGVFDAATALSSGAYSGNGTDSGAASNEWALTDRGYACNTSTYTNLSGTIGTVAQNKVVQVAVDMDNKKIWFGIDNTFSGDPAAGSGEAFDNLPSTILPLLYTAQSTQVFNFGQDSSFVGGKTSGSAAAADGNGKGDFFYAPPSGYLALCSANLPDVTIGPEQDTLADDNFNTVLWTGNGVDGRSITGVGFDPDWVWLKSRNLTTSHQLNDTVRGANKTLFSDSTAAEVNNHGAGYLSAFVTDGFSVTSSTNDDGVNDGSDTYVAWNWLAGTAFSNDASATSVGTIDSTGQVNTKAGFSIISYTGNGSSSQTVAHGLSSTPEFLIHKDRDTNSNNNQWNVYHAGAGDDYGYLSVTNAFTGAAQLIPSGTTTFELKANLATSNESGDDYIVYCFHSVDGYSKIDKYTGNGNADGPFVHTGFRPVWILLRESSAARNWVISYDDSTYYNGTTQSLFPNITQAEDANTRLDFLSNGFKLRTTSTSWNNNNGNYIYMAFADQPFKFSNAR